MIRCRRLDIRLYYISLSYIDVSKTKGESVIETGTDSSIKRKINTNFLLQCTLIYIKQNITEAFY